MGYSAVVVLQGCCSSRAHAVAVMVAHCLARLGLGSTRAIEAEFASFGYWDSPSNLIISPSPVLADTRARVLVLPKAYMGMMAEGEVEALLRRCCDEGCCLAEKRV
ncbi:MAG: hypothetical protein HPY55_01135 [Firmicutes bacterium]|nr:hypothetical protein [Bacillota bacterium]